MRLPDLTGWTPIRVYWRQSRPLVDWCYTGRLRFTAPFFDQTVEECLQRPFNLLFRHQTPIDALAEFELLQPGLLPSGFIFHMSRCGSTLVSQLLAALPHATVIAEAAPLDAVLHANLHDPGIADEQRLAWLRGMVSALGQRRQGQEQHYFVKFDCWNTLDLGLIRRAFPDVPWIFVYRDPVEVMVSHLKQRAGRMLPGPVEACLLGLDLVAAFQMPPEEYCARALGSICRAALEHQGGRSRLVHYRQLPEVVWSSLLDFFGVAHADADLERMGHAAQFHAKNPAAHFVDDTAAKRREATDLMRQMAERWVSEWYERLEAARAAQESTA